MLDFLTSPYFLLFARLCVGGVFLASALGKMVDREGTAVAMARYPFLPRGSGQFIAYTFPYVELVVSAMLVLGLFTRLAGVIAALLFMLFTGLVVYDLTRGQQESCHCFGRVSAEKLTPVAVVRNVALLGLSLLVAFSFDGFLSLDAPLNSATGGSWPLIAGSVPTLPVGESVLVVLLSLTGVAIVVFGEQAVTTVRGALRGMGFR